MANTDQVESGLSLPSGQEKKKSSGELIDMNWKSTNVEPSDASSFSVQNLSQDTSYEFYVRARNIIGDGPRSQVVLASTKRAISSGSSLTSIDSSSSLAVTLAATNSDNQQLDSFAQAASSQSIASQHNNHQQSGEFFFFEKKTKLSLFFSLFLS